jgi:uncharacterized damage-inducible protein DinB
MNSFIELVEYNVWANRRVASQIKDLVHENYFQDTNDCLGSMRQVLLHMLKANWIWLDLWKGQAIMDYPTSWDTFSVDEIEGVFNSLQENILQEINVNLDTKGERELLFSNGDEHVHLLKFWKTITLAVNHDTYYRGQISNMIETLGFEPAKTNLFDYYTRRIHA